MCPLCGSSSRHQHPNDPKMMICSNSECGGCCCDECWSAMKQEDLSPEDNNEFQHNKLTRMASYSRIRVRH